MSTRHALPTTRLASLLALTLAASACDGCDDGPGLGKDGGGGPWWLDVEAGVVDDKAGDAGGAHDDGGGAHEDGGGAHDDGGGADDDDGGANDDGGGAQDGDDAGHPGDGDDAGHPGDGDDAGHAGDGIDAGHAGDGDDAGHDGDGDVWIQLDWSDAYSPQSPSWSFSATPGWGAAQWAMAGDTWPEAWDRWNNLDVVDDPIGRVVEIGGGESMQLMLGLEELAGYDSAEVRLWGRSRATSSSVQFDVYNPLVDCGDSATTSQDWTVHVIDVDLGQCMVLGAGVQAVRVEPTSGTLALVRMRVTLKGASW